MSSRISFNKRFAPVSFVCKYSIIPCFVYCSVMSSKPAFSCHIQKELWNASHSTVVFLGLIHK